MFKKLVRICVLLLVIVALNFNETGIMPVFVLILCLSIAFYSFKKIFSQLLCLPKEFKLLICWLIWSLATGLLVSTNKELFLSDFNTAITLILTCLVIYAVIRYDHKSINYIIYALIITGIMQVIAIKFGLQPEEHIGKEREYGLAGNPNSLGLKMVYATFALIYLMFFIIKKLKTYHFILSLMTFYLFFEAILLSGSRKSALSFAVLVIVVLTVLLINRYKKISLKSLVLPLAILSVVIYFLAPILLAGTVLGDRFQDLEESGGVQSDIRYRMYKFGLELFYDNPVMGVGLNNYREYFYTGQYSHSDYIESLSSTGLVGFILYQLSYLILLVKSMISFLKSKSKSNRLLNGLVFSGTLVLKIIGFGIILYSSPSAMFVFTTLIGLYYINKEKYEKSNIYNQYIPRR